MEKENINDEYKSKWKNNLLRDKREIVKMKNTMDEWIHIDKNNRKILREIYSDIGWAKMCNINIVMQEAKKRNLHKFASDIWHYKGESYDYIIRNLVPRYAVVISRKRGKTDD